MELVRCPEHGTSCFLKTGVRDGPSKGKSFYVCRADACNFVLATDLPVSHCLLHEGFVVELQCLLPPQGTKEYRLLFRCTRSKAEKKQWCGYIPWQDPNSKEHSVTSKSQRASEPSHYPPIQQRNPFKVLDKNQDPSLWKQLIKGEDVGKMAGKKQREKEDPLLDQKKEQKPGPACWVEKDLSSGRVVKEKSAGQEKPRGEKAELRCEAKRREGMHKRHLPEMKSKQCPGNEPRKPPAAPQEDLDGESHYVQKESEPLREEKSRPLPQTVRSQNPVDKPPEAGRLSKEQPRSREARETQAKDDPGTQATQERRLPGPLRAQAEAHAAPAPKGPAPGPAPAPPAAGPSPGERREADTSSGEEDDVVFVCSQPRIPSFSDTTSDARKKETLPCPGQTVQRKTPPASGVSRKVEPSVPASQRASLTTQLKQKKSTLASVNVQLLPDKGQKLREQIQELEETLSALALSPEQGPDEKSSTQAPQQSSVIKTTTAPPHLVAPKPLQLQGQDLQPLGSWELKAASQAAAGQSSQRCGSSPNQDRLHAVWKITSEAIDELHRSLESCPGETAVAEDPAGLKVPLLLHQKQALAWLLWRESQKPQGGILADDMGLGKTLTMIALILTQKDQEKNKEKDKNTALTWLSKDGIQVPSWPVISYIFI